MDANMHFIMTLFLYSLFLTDNTQGGNLTCFYCHDTGNNRNCWDEKYLKSAAYHQNDYVRRCNDEEYCLIEQFMQYGKVKSLIRDCNNKDDFSVEKKGRLKHIIPDNTTVCSFGAYLVCISLCSESYCNGPLESNPNSVAIHMNKMVIVVFFSFISFCSTSK